MGLLEPDGQAAKLPDSVALRQGRDSAATRVWTGVALYKLLVAGELRVLAQTGLAIAAWCGAATFKKMGLAFQTQGSPQGLQLCTN